MTQRLSIATSRLILRPLAIADSADFHRLCVEPGVRKFLWDDQLISLERAARVVEESTALFVKEGLGLWKISTRDDESMIGFCGYLYFHEPPRLQLLYAIAPQAWGKGLATEAAREMIRYGFDDPQLDRIEASADAPNAASLRVLEKAGMTFDRRELINGLDTAFYSIARDEVSRLDAIRGQR